MTKCKHLNGVLSENAVTSYSATVSDGTVEDGWQDDKYITGSGRYQCNDCEKTFYYSKSNCPWLHRLIHQQVENESKPIHPFARVMEINGGGTI